MDYLEEEEQSCVINPAPQLFGSMNLLNGLIGWGKQKRLSFITKSNNANSSSSFVQADASPKSSIEEEEVSSKVSVAKIAIKQGDEEVEEDGNDDEEADDATEEEVDMNQKRKRYSSSTSLLSTCASTRKKRKGENN